MLLLLRTLILPTNENIFQIFLNQPMFHQYSLNLSMKIFVGTFSISHSPFLDCVSLEPALFSFHQVGSVFRHTSTLKGLYISPDDREYTYNLKKIRVSIIKSYALPASPLSHYPGIVSSSHISHISGHHMSRADPGTREDRRARSHIAEKDTTGIKAGAYYNLTS